MEGIPYRTGGGGGVRLFHGQAFLWADFDAAAALNAAQSFNFPAFGWTVHHDGAGGAFSAADTAEDAGAYVDADVSPRGGLPLARHGRIHQGCRFAEKTFQHFAGYSKQGHFVTSPYS
jgi:hypothetical protein